MPSKAFTSAKTKLLARQFGTTLGEKYKANEQEFAAARVGSSLVAIEGQLYPGAIAGDAATVTNSGRPAAAQYTAGGGGVVVQSSGGVGGSAGSGFVLDTPGTLSSTSINNAAGQHTHQIDLTIARTPGTLTDLSINENTTVGHTHLVDASADPDLTSKLLKTNTSGQVILRELRVRDALGGSTGITYDGTGPLFQHGLRSADDDRTAYFGRAIVGGVGHSDYAGFAHRDFATTTGYALLQDGLDGETFLNATDGKTIYHRINNTDTFRMTAGNIAMAGASGTVIGSDNYVSQLTGWRMTYSGALDARYIHTDELHAKAFIADLEQALAGGQIICKSVTTLARDFRASYPGAYATLYVDDLPSAENMQVFQANDYIRLRTFNRSGGGLDITNCWGVVSSPADLSDKQQSWRYTRSGTTTYSVIGWRTATSATSASGASIGINKPTGTVANDVMIAGISYIANAGQTLAAPAGWIRIFRQVHTNGTLILEAWYKVAGGSEPTSYTFTLSAAATYASAMQSYSNCLLVNSPIDIWSVQNNTSSSIPAGTLTPISARAGAVFIGTLVNNTPVSPPGGMVEQVDVGSTGIRIELANQTMAVQGALSMSGLIGNSYDNIGAAILLMPAYTSSLDATTGQMYPGATIGAKAIILDYGVSGNGFYEVSAIDGIYGQNSPYSQIATWTGHPATGTVLRVRTGNLRGVFGVADEYGTYMGNGTGVTNQYLRLSSYTNEIHNLPIKMYDGSGNEFFKADTAGLTYTVPANSDLQAQTSITFKTPGGSNVLRFGGHSTISDGRFGWLKLDPGTTDSQLFLQSQSPSGYYSNVIIQNTVGGSSSQWLFKSLADGTVGADFSGYLSLNGTTPPWTTAGWNKSLVFSGQGHAMVWPKGAGSTSRGIGVSTNGILYIGRSTADDGSAAVTYDMFIDTTGVTTFGNSIKTPLGAAFDVGQYTAGAPGATGWVAIKLGTVTYKLLAST